MIWLPSYQDKVAWIIRSTIVEREDVMHLVSSCYLAICHSLQINVRQTGLTQLLSVISR